MVNNLIKRCANHDHFRKDSPEQLWVWQGQRRVDIKESLGLELPSVYGPPKAKIIHGRIDQPFSGQFWHVETAQDITTDLCLRTAAAGRPAGYVLKLSESADREPQEKFCRTINQMGLAGVSVPLRGCDQPAGVFILAEIYLGLARCYAGSVVTDLMRVIDHLEHQFSIDVEPIVLMLSGLGIPAGLALTAIDQRISALVIDFTSAPKSILAPVGSPPFFKDQFLHLGPNPLLVLAQCCAPRPMAIVNYPPDAQAPWLKNHKVGVLSFVDQLAQIQNAYDAANYTERLQIFGPDKTQPQIPDLIRQSLEYFQNPKK